MARGGRRAGRAGVKYPNRTDLQGAQLPANAPTGLPYGDRAKLMAAQRAVPMGTAGAGTVSPPAGGQGTPPSPGPQPGTLPFLGDTERPGEPVTAGLPVGPGPGPEALSGGIGGKPMNPLFQAVAALDMLGSTADAETAHLRDSIHAALSNQSVP